MHAKKINFSLIEGYECGAISPHMQNISENGMSVTGFCHLFCSLSFYLKHPHAKGISRLYAAFSCMGERVRLATDIRISPIMWDRKNEQLYYGFECDKLSVLINKKILEYKNIFSIFVLQEYDFKTIVQEFRKLFNMGKKRNIQQVDINELLRKGLILYYADKDNENEDNKTKSTTIAQNKSLLNALCRAIDDMIKKGISVKPSQEGYERLRGYLIKSEKKEDGRVPLSANNKANLFARLLNHIRMKEEYKCYNIEKIEHRKFGVQLTYKDTLKADEVKALEDLDGLNKKENSVRYLFLIECECSHRISDKAKVIQAIENSEIDDVEIINEQKEGNFAAVYVTEKLKFYMSNVDERYINIDTDTYNEILRSIAKKANLNRFINNGYNKPLCECLSSHWGRHTAITRMSKEMSYADVQHFSGHKSVAVIEKVYTHTTNEERKEKIKNIVKKINDNKQIAQQEVKPSRFPNSVSEAQQILKFLGVETEETNLGKLLGKIYLRESEILKLCNSVGLDIITIKDFFNTDASLEDRCTALHEIVSSCLKE